MGPRTYLPEPLDLLAVLGVVSVNSVLLPVAHVYLLHAAQHELQGRQMSVAQGQPRPHSLADKSIPNIFLISADSGNNRRDMSVKCGPLETV